jgi:hypothetical protein
MGDPWESSNVGKFHGNPVTQWEVSFAGHHGTSMVDFRTFDYWITAWSPAKSQQKT